MRLTPGTRLDEADAVLLEAETTWRKVRHKPDAYRAYLGAVASTHLPLSKVFAAPDVGGGMRSAAYWALLSIGMDRETSFGKDFIPTDILQRVWRLQFGACEPEIEHQIRALEQARGELENLKKLAARPGLPVIYDTNMLNHWAQPGDVRWREVFKAHGEDVRLTRLIVPLRVIDELDRQKYGSGELAKRAATALRYLERTLHKSGRGEPVSVRPEATLEVWTDDGDRSRDADLSILRCAADVANLGNQIDVRVLTGDFGMRLRAQQMDLQVLQLPDGYRKAQQGSTNVQ